MSCGQQSWIEHLASRADKSSLRLGATCSMRTDGICYAATAFRSPQGPISLSSVESVARSAHTRSAGRSFAVSDKTTCFGRCSRQSRLSNGSAFDHGKGAPHRATFSGSFPPKCDAGGLGLISTQNGHWRRAAECKLWQLRRSAAGHNAISSQPPLPHSRSRHSKRSHSMRAHIQVGG